MAKSRCKRTTSYNQSILRLAKAGFMGKKKDSRVSSSVLDYNIFISIAEFWLLQHNKGGDTVGS